MKRKTITGLLFLGCSVGCVLLFIHVTTQPEPMHLTNPESRETALWNVRVQVRATGPSADRSGWETVHNDYPAGPGPAHIEPAKSSEFQVNSPGRTYTIFYDRAAGGSDAIIREGTQRDPDS